MWYIHKANKNSINTKLIATFIAEIMLKFLQLHLNYLEGIYTVKFEINHSPRRETRQAKMTKSPSKEKKKASLSCVG